MAPNAERDLPRLLLAVVVMVADSGDEAAVAAALDGAEPAERLAALGLYLDMADVPAGERDAVADKLTADRLRRLGERYRATLRAEMREVDSRPDRKKADRALRLWADMYDGWAPDYRHSDPAAGEDPDWTAEQVRDAAMRASLPGFFHNMGRAGLGHLLTEEQAVAYFRERIAQADAEAMVRAGEISCRNLEAENGHPYVDPNADRFRRQAARAQMRGDRLRLRYFLPTTAPATAAPSGARARTPHRTGRSRAGGGTSASRGDPAPAGDDDPPGPRSPGPGGAAQGDPAVDTRHSAPSERRRRMGAHPIPRSGDLRPASFYVRRLMAGLLRRCP